MKMKKLFIIAIVVSTAGLCLASSTAKGDVEVEGDIKVNLSVSHPGKGSVKLQSTNGDLVARINVKYTSFDEDYAWIAGKCTGGESELQDKWIFAAVNDGGKPGSLVDYIWWEWLDSESAAKSKVENLEIPSDNKSIEKGNIVVK
jgi:hypothetical protein